MKFKIHPAVLANYPYAQIGVIVATKINNSGHLPLVTSIVNQLPAQLRLITNPADKNKPLDKENLSRHPQIDQWRTTYTNFGLKPSTYKSSVEALTRRAVGKDVKLWKINPAVDLYNTCSCLSLYPMGGYDIRKVNGDIEIRYAHKDEHFDPLGADPFQAKGIEVVYADNEGAICYAWNYKDTKRTCIDNNTTSAIFFIDSSLEVKNPFDTVEDAVNLLGVQLQKMGAEIRYANVFTKNKPEADLDMQVLLSNNASPLSLELPTVFKPLFDEKMSNKESDEKNVKKNPAKNENAKVLANADAALFSSKLMTKKEYLANPSSIIHVAATGDANSINYLVNDMKVQNLASITDNGGCNLIMHATRGNYAGIVGELLATKQFDINYQNRVGDTALMIAVRFQLTEVITTLMKYTPSLEIKDNRGTTALDLAGNNPEILSLLKPNQSSQLSRSM